MTIIKTAILLFLISLSCTALIAQASSFHIGLNTIPSWYNNKNLDVIDLDRFKEDQAQEFTQLHNLNFEHQFDRTFGIQVGVQYHVVNLVNDEFTCEPRGHSVKPPYFQNYNFGIRIKKRLFETPVGLIVRQSINPKLHLDVILSGSVIFKLPEKYRITEKSSGEIDRFQVGNRWKLYSKYSPQIKARIKYQIQDRWSVVGGLLFKSERVSNFDHTYLGCIIGLQCRVW